MRLYLKTPNDQLEVEVKDESITVAELKAAIQEKFGFQARALKLKFVGKEIQDSNTLKDYSITDDYIIFLSEKTDFDLESDLTLNDVDQIGIATLVSYGFTNESATEAFLLSNKNVEVALNYLLDNHS